MMRLRLLGICAFFLGSAGVTQAQTFQSFLVEMKNEGSTKGPASVPVIFTVIAGERPLTVWSTLTLRNGEYGTMVRLPSALQLQDLRTVTMKIRLTTESPQSLQISQPKLAPMLYESGTPSELTMREAASTMLERTLPVNTVFGFPVITHTAERAETRPTEYTISMTEGLKFACQRSDRNGDPVKMLPIQASVDDGARADSDCKVFAETWDGQLLHLPIGIRDGMNTNRSVRIRNSIVPSELKSYHFFMTRKKFEDGTPLPNPSSTDGGDDMSLALSLMISGFPSVRRFTINDWGSRMTGPYGAQTQRSYVMMATHIGIWMETGELPRSGYMDPVLHLDLKGGKTITIRINEGLSHSHMTAGYNAHNVFCRSIRLPLNGITGSDIGLQIGGLAKFGVEAPLPAIPVHAVTKATLRLNLTGSPGESRREWDLKGMIIALGRGTRFQPTSENDWVPLYVNPSLNKRFVASRDTGIMNDRQLEFPVDFSPVKYSMVVSTGR